MLNRLLNHLEEWLIATLIAVATSIVFVAVLHRYGTANSIDFAKWLEAHGMAMASPCRSGPSSAGWQLDLSWAQELCIYLFIWMAKFGAAYGVRTGIHVGVDVLVMRLPPARAKKVILFGLLAGALFTAVIANFGAHFTWSVVGVGHALERPRGADVDRLHGDPARLLADVLSLPAGGLAFLAHRVAAAPRRGACRRHGRRRGSAGGAGGAGEAQGQARGGRA